MDKFKDETGNKYGKLIVVKRSTNNSKCEARWVCNCSCGKSSIVSGCKLRSGATKSCGCNRGNKNKIVDKKTYRSWANMKYRCYRKKNKDYKHYGARGIKVCKRWLNSFDSFCEDMGKIKPTMTLDRIDNNGDYSPENCRWATMKEQNNNRRYNYSIEFKGKKRNAAQIARMIGMNPGVLQLRLYRGWSIERAINQPVITNDK